MLIPTVSKKINTAGKWDGIVIHELGSVAHELTQLIQSVSALTITLLKIATLLGDPLSGFVFVVKCEVSLLDVRSDGFIDEVNIIDNQFMQAGLNQLEV